MKILNSRAAVYVQSLLISIAEFSVRRRAATLLRESEYMLRATAITYTQWEHGEVVLFLYHSLLLSSAMGNSGTAFFGVPFILFHTSFAEDWVIYICKGVFFYV